MQKGIEKRIEALEDQVGGEEQCQCKYRFRVIYDDPEGEPQPEPPERCPVCGGLRDTIQVVYAEQTAKDGQERGQ